MRDLLLMACVQFVSYANLTINFRAIAAGHIGYAMATDALASAIAYFIVRKVAKSEGGGVLVGMMIGGSLAAWFGIWLTQAWT
jgi:hypothetical protein